MRNLIRVVRAEGHIEIDGAKVERPSAAAKNRKWRVTTRRKMFDSAASDHDSDPKPPPGLVEINMHQWLNGSGLVGP